MSAIAWELPEEVRAVRDGLIDFARKEVLPRHDRHHDLFENPRRLYREDGRFSDELKGLIGEVRRASARAGYYNMCVPESLGGGLGLHGRAGHEHRRGFHRRLGRRADYRDRDRLGPWPSDRRGTGRLRGERA